MISKDTLYSQLDFRSTYILSTKGNTPNRKKIFIQLQRDHALELLRMYREHVRQECTLKHDYDDDINRIYKNWKRAKNWIALGYSFNDEYVKAMFLEVLKDPNLSLYIHMWMR
jgi:hypothetical protein